MAWIESHEEVSEHPKTFKLAALLKVPTAHAVGLVHCLWHFTLKFAWRDGNLKRFGSDEIARGSKWEGDAAQFIASLQKSGWMDGSRVHDWDHYAGEIIYQRKYNAKRRSLRKINKPNLTAVSQLYGAVKSPLPYPTLPYPTLPTKEESSGEAPPLAFSASPLAATAPLAKANVSETIKALSQAKHVGGKIALNPDYKKPDTPLQKFLLVIKQLEGFKLDDANWDGVYFKRYARAAKDMLTLFNDDWKKAGRCAEEIANWLIEIGRSWTVETILKHASKWKSGLDWKGKTGAK